MKPNLNRQVLFFICVLIVTPSFSQTYQVQFGQVDKEELTRHSSAIEKTAEAEVLYENYDVSLALFSGMLEINIKAHTRIKIYNEKGLDEANIKIPYIAKDGAEGIFKLEGQTYNMDPSGNIIITKLDKKSIYDKKINNRISNQVFTFPEVKSGSIIEYRYTVKRKLLYFDNWTFQRSIPVRYSNCTIEYPSEFRFSTMAMNTLPMETDIKQTGYNIRKSFTMKNLPGLKDEPYISCDKDYMQQVRFQMNGYFSPDMTLDLNRNWPAIVKMLSDDVDFGQQLVKNIKRTPELEYQLSGSKSEAGKMAAVYNYVKQNIAWDGTNSIWAQDGVKHAWEVKMGNSGEINLMLVNLLIDAGLNASPLLVSTRSHGRVNTLEANLNQFNTVMALVRIGSDIYVLDATEKETPCHIIPRKVMYTEGLVINNIHIGREATASDWGWISLWNDKQKYNRLVSLSAEMGSNGVISGQAFIMNSEYARLSTLKEWKDEKEKITEHYTHSQEGLKLADFSQKNEERDSLPLEHQFKFELPSNESGEFRYFSLNLFSGLEQNPFIADERSSDVTYGVNQKLTLRGIFTIPEGFAFEELPKDTKLMMPDKSLVMSRMMQASGNKISYSVNIEFNQPIYTLEAYPEFKEFYKSMFDLLNEQIVIKNIKP